MRAAIISDIHGNLLALDAVLADLDAEGLDRIVCLGDVAAFGPQPGEVLARLSTVGCPVVMGNTDEWLLDPQPHELRDEDSQRVTEVELWSAQQLSPADLEQVRTFRPTLELSLDGDTSLLCFHGSPQSKTDVIRSTTPDAELERMLGGSRATIMAGGHSHTQMLRRFGNVMLLNPGSVGLTYERDPVTDRVRHPAWAEYAIVSWENQNLTIQFRRVPFDARALVRVALDSGMPHAEWWVRDWSTGGSR